MSLDKDKTLGTTIYSAGGQILNIVTKENNVDGLEHPNTKMPDTRNEIKTVDNVNHPDHYIHDGIETIDVIKAWCGPGFSGYLEGNIIKYISRWRDKNGLEDLKKARWYLNKLIEERESRM